MALLVQDVDELGLEILVRVPGAARDRPIRFHVVQHVDFFLSSLLGEKMHIWQGISAISYSHQYYHYSNRIHGFDELFSFEGLEDFVERGEAEVGLVTNVPGPNAFVSGFFNNLVDNFLFNIGSLVGPFILESVCKFIVFLLKQVQSPLEHSKLVSVKKDQ